MKTNELVSNRIPIYTILNDLVKKDINRTILNINLANVMMPRDMNYISKLNIFAYFASWKAGVML